MSVTNYRILGWVMFGFAFLSACAQKTSIGPSVPSSVNLRLWIAEPSGGYRARGCATFNQWREIADGHAAKMLLTVLEQNQAKSSVGIPLFNMVCRPIGFVIESNGQVIRAGWYNEIVKGKNLVVVKYARASGNPGKFLLTPTSRSPDFLLWDDLEGCLVNSDKWGKLELPSDL